MELGTYSNNSEVGQPAAKFSCSIRFFFPKSLSESILFQPGGGGDTQNSMY